MESNSTPRTQKKGRKGKKRSKGRDRLKRIHMFNPLPTIPEDIEIDCSWTGAQGPGTAMNCGCQAVSSQQVFDKECLEPHPPDFKYITRRNRGEDRLDWNYEALGSDYEITCIIISDDEDESAPPVKPMPLEPACLESNIESSSQKVVDLSSLGKEKRDQIWYRLKDRSKTPPDQLTSQYKDRQNQAHTAKAFRQLLSNEKKLEGVVRTPSLARSCIVNWLTKVNGPNGDPAVVQSACYHLDSILAKKHIPIKKLQMVASACFWIAQKMYHQTPMPALRLVKHSDLVQELLDTEWKILEMLNFPKKPIIPQDYIGYFAWWCNEHQPGEIEESATFIVMAGIQFFKYWRVEYPSVVAAAAVHSAIMLLKKEELLDKLRSCPVYCAAQAKALDFRNTCASQRQSIRTIANPRYNYRYLLTRYGLPPLCTAQKITEEANKTLN